MCPSVANVSSLGSSPAAISIAVALVNALPIKKAVQVMMSMEKTMITRPRPRPDCLKPKGRLNIPTPMNMFAIVSPACFCVSFLLLAACSRFAKLDAFLARIFIPASMSKMPPTSVSVLEGASCLHDAALFIFAGASESTLQHCAVLEVLLPASVGC
eukprot:TRINITY_DN24658_c0_g3_i1.p1 TRINITY_DN24658_c0_g3~~TRINITY_DN24658_c0_g3_i1.p1  ORF type:complete len:157 (+),score=29.69 TRINITY_DN24658_c0_g3_i1:133-603(+)